MNLEHIKILDHHAHALFREDIWRKTPIEAFLSEAYDPIMLERFVPDNVFARRSIRELADFYGCEPTRASVLEARAAWNYTDLARAMFAQTGIEMVLVDDGIWLELMQPLEQKYDRAALQARVAARDRVSGTCANARFLGWLDDGIRGNAARTRTKTRGLEKHHRLPHRTRDHAPRFDQSRTGVLEPQILNSSWCSPSSERQGAP
jgi:hypothetical protein